MSVNISLIVLKKKNVWYSSSFLNNQVWTIVFERSCLNDRVWTIMFERSCLNDRVWTIMFERSCLNDRVWTIVFEWSCLNDRVCTIMFERSCLNSVSDQCSNSVLDQITGVYISPKLGIFCPHFPPKIPPPLSTEKMSTFSLPFPIIFALLPNISSYFFLNQPKTHIFDKSKIKNIHPYIRIRMRIRILDPDLTTIK